MSVPPPASSHQSISQLVLRDALDKKQRDLERAKQLHTTKERRMGIPAWEFTTEKYENEDEKKKQNKKSKNSTLPLKALRENWMPSTPCIGRVNKT
jgi:hypothetical protein